MPHFLPPLVVVIYEWECANGHYCHYQVAAWESCHLSYGVCVIIGVTPPNTPFSLDGGNVFSGRTLKGTCLGGRSVNRRDQLVALKKFSSTLWNSNMEFKIPFLGETEL